MINRYLLGAVILIVVFGGGYYLGSGNVEIQERIITKEGQKEIQIVERVVTRTVTIQPDGTRTETETTTDRTEDREETTSETDEGRVVVYTRPEYSIGLQFHQDYKQTPNIYNDFRDPKNWDVILGTRMLGPIWMEAGVGLDSYVLGLRVEF